MVRLEISTTNVRPPQTWTLEISPTELASGLKLQIERLSGISQYKQKLYHSGQYLDSDTALSKYELEEGAKLKLVVKMPMMGSYTYDMEKEKAAADADLQSAGVISSLKGKREDDSRSDLDGEEDEDEEDGEQEFTAAEEEEILRVAAQRRAGLPATTKKQKGDVPPPPPPAQK